MTAPHDQLPPETAWLDRATATAGPGDAARSRDAARPGAANTAGPTRHPSHDAALDAAVGSVAEEAAKLLRALGGVATAAGADGVPGADAGHAGPGSTAGSHPREHGRPERSGDGPSGDTGHVPMGQAQSCTWCPVCRGVTLIRSLSPETLERMADLATVAAVTFADLATRAAARGGPGWAAGTPGSPQTGADEPPTHTASPPSAPGAARTGRGGVFTQSVPVADDDQDAECTT